MRFSVARSTDQASRALANVDAVIERARAYGVRGFRQFARDLDADWARRASQTEGVVDAEGQSIDMVTIHSSKGLEWPVVIPINMASTPRSLESFVHRRTDDTLHWMLGDIIPPTLAGALQSEGQEEAQQRLRLLYVACTRAMDLLVLPELSWSDAAAWARTVDFRLGVVPELNIAAFRKKPFVKAHEIPNAQTAQVFAQERSTLDAAFERVAWIHPSEKDQDIVQFEMSSVAAWEQPIDALAVTGGGSVRGSILHKLMEELLAGELREIPGRRTGTCRTAHPATCACRTASRARSAGAGTNGIADLCVARVRHRSRRPRSRGACLRTPWQQRQPPGEWARRRRPLSRRPRTHCL